MRAAHLDERMRYEGRAGKLNESGLCQFCYMETGTVRCEECLGRDIICRGCCIKVHACLPLHRIKEWNGHYFAPVTLRDIGLRVQLGETHEPGSLCIWGREVHKDLVIIHTNGMHKVAVHYCGCTPNIDTPKIDVFRQFLRIGWYPATHLEPKTCATFDVMQLFHLLSLQGKTSHYDFYKTMQFRTENTGITKFPVSSSFDQPIVYLMYFLSTGIGHSSSSRASGDTRPCSSEGEELTTQGRIESN